MAHSGDDEPARDYPVLEPDVPMYRSNWRFGQCFGEREADEEFSDADLLSAVEFDTSGEFLATGDKGGRVVIFQRMRPSKLSVADDPAASGVPPAGSPHYKFFTEFQSHDAEFDYLKSQEIEEKINQICWCYGSNGSRFLLTTNDKTIKQWRVQERKVHKLATRNVLVGEHGGVAPVRALHVPKLQPAESQVVATSRRVYANAHTYHINSISANTDGEHFLSADDLRVNLWSLDNAKVSFNIVDIKPTNMEDLTEVITAAEFHPVNCHMFAFSTSRGSIKLGDMRERALCDSHAKSFADVEEDAATKNYFSEIIVSASDVKFTSNGRYMLSRDFMNVKVWDIHMEGRPVLILPVHEHLRAHLNDLYENDSIFDKFEVASSGDSLQILTGSYNNGFKIFDTRNRTDTCVELSKVRALPPVVRPLPDPRDHSSMMMAAASHDPGALDFVHKVLHYSWHPETDTVAIAGLNNLYIYNAQREYLVDGAWVAGERRRTVRTGPGDAAGSAASSPGSTASSHSATSPGAASGGGAAGGGGGGGGGGGAPDGGRRATLGYGVDAYTEKLGSGAGRVAPEAGGGSGSWARTGSHTTPAVDDDGGAEETKGADWGGAFEEHGAPEPVSAATAHSPFASEARYL